jgi:hypothetical protein
VGRYKAAETRYADDARQYEALQARLAALRQQLDATEAPTKKLRAEFEKVERQTGQTAQRLEQGGAALQKLSAGLGAAGIDVLDLARHEERLATQTQEANATLRQQTAQLDKVNAARRASEKMGEISSKATGMGLSAIAAGTATAAPLVVATKQAMTLESAMADVRKVVNFPTPQAFAQMSDDILEMSTRIPMSAEGIAQIVAAAGRPPCRARNCWALPRMPPRWASPSTAPPKRPGRPWPSGAPPSSCPSPAWSRWPTRSTRSPTALAAMSAR